MQYVYIAMIKMLPNADCMSNDFNTGKAASL